jgi:protein-tyrosine phosphatase
MPPVHRICNGVYIGGLVALLDVGVMSNIGSVLTLIEFGRVKEEIFPLCYEDRPHKRVPLRDREIGLLEQSLEEMCQFIETHRKENVLIHCVEGHSRSAVVAAAFLLWKYPAQFPTVEAAIERVHKKRPGAKISSFYRDILHAYFFSTTSTEDS